MTRAGEWLQRAGFKRPLNWEELGSSAKDLWEERQVTSMTKELLTHPPRHTSGEVCLRAVTTFDCGLGHEYHGDNANGDERVLMHWAWEHVS